jgi:hypothetical protein
VPFWMMKISAIFTRNWGRIPYATPAAFTRAIRRSMRVCVNYPCPFPARKLHGLSCPAKSRCAFWRRRPTRRMILKSLTSWCSPSWKTREMFCSGFCRTANCRCRSAWRRQSSSQNSIRSVWRSSGSMISMTCFGSMKSIWKREP